MKMLAAAVLCSDEFAKKHGISNPVYIAGQAMASDFGSSFGDSMIKMVGYDMTKAADRGMTITGVRLLEKHGGKSGSFVAQV